ncbi:TMEM175 family protein [Luteimonas vadosa]|uniref:DUF1211 domain-containing protein n=1 Tax=Luteimonas vadosa TaxID=1165507 RepID=A0ABP9DSW6_9GAMM
MPRQSIGDRDGDGFRLRGQHATRLETFIDASFAFSLTLLVISYNQLPDTVAELRQALMRVPTFIASFALIAMFWNAHHRWSRRFGLHDGWTTLLGLAMVLTVLVYVYPLRMVISSFLSLLSGGWLPSELGVGTSGQLADVQAAFIIYSVGFGLLAWIMWRLNVHALRHADALALDDNERHQLGTEAGVYRILFWVAVLSILASLLVLWIAPAFDRRIMLLAGLPMWLYAALSVVMPLYAMRRGRQWKARRPPGTE